MDELRRWLHDHEGVAHRRRLLRAGFSPGVLRAAVRAGAVTVIRRAWFSVTSDAELLLAATTGGRLTCLTLARRRGWWVTSPAVVPHLHFPPGSRADAPSEAVTHWSIPFARSEPALVADMEDALQHIAGCLPKDEALAVWESAVRVEKLAPEYLRSLAWTSTAARELAEAVNGLSDSGLETLLVTPLRRWGVLVRQQVWLAGRPVDILVGERLVIQIDGWQFHASAAQRAKDIAHDAELRLRGYTVLRFGYAQIVHDREAVLRVIRQSIAARLHLVA